MQVKYTEHAEDMLIERNFSKELVEDVVYNYDWKVEEDDVWHAYKRVKGKVLHVVVKGKSEPYTVITVFFDRRVK